ncbi:MAG: hypothetical protein ACI88G_001395, partial [Woeseiaceae bacterium]
DPQVHAEQSTHTDLTTGFFQCFADDRLFG